ncbi:MAG: T9SS type A sorting domain-containing protein [Saprospiraceae bacterium]|nr:T9SS type A sorting domain-containing protein [Saprospiraceae bacterium]
MKQLFLYGLKMTGLILVTSICLAHPLFAACPPQTSYPLPCNTDTSLIPKPVIGDLVCFGPVTSVSKVLPVRIVMTPGTACDSACFSKEFRQWTVKRMGLADTFFLDTICFTKITMADVICPRDTIIYCITGATLDTTTAILGSPLKNQGIPCNILQPAPIVTLWASGSKGCFKFSREWKLIDWCTSPAVMMTCTQTIEVRDTVAPTIISPGPLPDVSVSGTHCQASATLPAVVVTDNCSTAAQISVSVEVAGITINTNGGRIDNIPLGTHTVTYTASDGCGNSKSVTTELEIYDGQAPLAFCKGPKIIQIPALGMVSLPSTAFDDGSNDYCGPVSIKVRRMTNTPPCTIGTPSLYPNPFNRFADEVKFCCSDAGQEVMVIMRVYQGIVPWGVVSLDQYTDLPYTDCMTSVKVLDKVGPTITCPAGVEIDCRQLGAKRVKSLTDYGTATIQDMCLDTVWIDSISMLGQCLVGDLIRKINAKDKAGNVSSCEQIIKVVNNDPFDPYDTADFEWPRDTTFFICAAVTTPSVTGMPKIKDLGCSKVAFDFVDEIYQFAPGACKKILRKWSVVDWCQVEPTVPKSGRWVRTQAIVVMDTIKPVITVPANFTVNNGNDACAPILVNVPVPSATDCTPTADLEWTYVLDLFSDGLQLINGAGKNASQMMPNGIHTLEFRVSDKCGNVSSGKTIITVKDSKKPTPVAMNGLATDLSLMNGTAMARVFASYYFLQGSASDNCTPFNKLKFSYSTNTNDTVRIYTCDSIGTRAVRLWVTDEAGNQDVVATYILIQNNMGACTNPAPTPSLRTVGIEGKIITETGKDIDLVHLKIMQDNVALPDPYIAPGKYSANGLLIGQSYEIIPKKDINPLNGVSTVDLIMMQKHILGITPLSTAYKMIAADIDRSGDINGIDLLELRKLILGIDKNFSNNESWRFIDATHQFTNVSSTLQDKFGETYNIQELERPMEINFIGVKVGDVNGSSLSNELNNLEGRENVTPFHLSFSDKNFVTGEVIRVDVSAKNESQVYGLQMSLNHPGLEYMGIESKLLGDDVIATHTDHHQLKISIANNDPMRLDPKMTWYTLVFKATQAGSLSESISLNTKSDMSSELYDSQLNSHPINLQWTDNASIPTLKLTQNQPNPFNNETIVSYYLPHDTKVSLKIFDLNSRLLFEQKINAVEGKNNWTITSQIFKTSGIYYYRVESLYGTGTNKMILLQ